MHPQGDEYLNYVSLLGHLTLIPFMVITRSGFNTSNNPITMEPSDSGPSGTGNVDPFATAPPSPIFPGSFQPSSMEAVLRTMMEMMLKQDEIRLAAEKAKEE